MRITTRRLQATLTALAMGTLLPVTAAQAAAIIGATSVSADVASYNAAFDIGTPNRTINQSGLSTAYVSGQTDFDSYVATTTHRSATGQNTWFAIPGTKAARVTYGFGSSPVVIDALALWNGHSNLTFKDFNILGDAGQLLGTYAVTTDTMSGGNLPAQVFAFHALSTTSITLDFTSTFNQSTVLPSLGEVAFRAGTLATANTPAAAVPEPGSFALAGLALAGLVLSRRRRG